MGRRRGGEKVIFDSATRSCVDAACCPLVERGPGQDALLVVGKYVAGGYPHSDSLGMERKMRRSKIPGLGSCGLALL